MKLIDIDLTGKKVGLITVIRRSSNSHRHWFCKCSCGTTKNIYYVHLARDRIKSCGCLQRKVASQTAKITSRKHGMRRTPTYNSWQGMKSRCYRTTDPDFYRYGARGIKVCDHWKDSFENFYKDMGDRPAGKSLDRIDNDSNYKPENCRWSTCKEQQNNRSSNAIYTYKGRSQNIRAWATEYNIKYGTLQSRLFMGWSIERALETPVRTRKST